MAFFSARRFLTEPGYRDKEAIPALAYTLKKAWQGMAKEGKESLQALGHLVAAADGRSLTAEEKTQVKTQLQDLAKAVPMLAVFLLPGGMLFLPLLLKVLPFDLRPSAFKEMSEEARQDSEAAS